MFVLSWAKASLELVWFQDRQGLGINSVTGTAQDLGRLRFFQSTRRLLSSRILANCCQERANLVPSNCWCHVSRSSKCANLRSRSCEGNPSRPADVNRPESAQIGKT